MEPRIAMAADGNDSYYSPISLGTVWGDANWTSDVGSAYDNQDCFRFTLPVSGYVSLQLDDLYADLDLELVNTYGQRIARSVLNGTNVDTIRNVWLNAGTYFLRVYKGTSNARSSYSLHITRMFADPNGNGSMSTATYLGYIPIRRALSGQINVNPSNDSNDYYRIELNRYATFRYTLTPMQADLDIELLDIYGRVLRRGTNGSNNLERGVINLGPGSYFLRVYAGVSGARSDYMLTTAYA